MKVTQAEGKGGRKGACDFGRPSCLVGAWMVWEAGVGSGSRDWEASEREADLVFQADGLGLNQGRRRRLERERWIPEMFRWPEELGT